MQSLKEAWETNAADWIEWARSPELDHAFWRMNLPTLLELLPAPEGPTLDLACGEGRVARALKHHGYSVAGLESSPTLAAAAVAADPSFEVRVGDAAHTPWPDRSFVLVVVSLALMNMDEMPAVVSEIARVLRPGGCLCASVLHPAGTWVKSGGNSYFETVRYAERLESHGSRVLVNDTHRPLHDYFDAFASAGLAVERLVEPVPDDAYLTAVPQVRDWIERPAFLHLRARLAG